MSDRPSLSDAIPPGGFPDDAQALDALLAWIASGGIELYPAQEEAILELFDGAHVILETPTGSGKSLVALALHFRELAAGRRSVYTAPIKALVSEKFLALCEVFGAANVGMMTGDGAVNRDAPIVCCTAEVLSKIALRHGTETPFAAVVMDEFHYYGDRDRGMAWQVPLLTMTHARFLLMSATLGNTEAIATDLGERTDVRVATVSSMDRPVPLEFVYSTTKLVSKLHDLVTRGNAPVYAVHFTQRAASELAQSLLSTDPCTAEEKEALKKAIKGARFDSPYGPTLRRLVLHGIGIHHAGLLPRYRLLVEQLSQKGLFKVICGTDTLGVGINVPIRTVLFTQLCKYDGEAVRILRVRDFKQIAGRAGRKGFDEQGTVVVQAPAWVIDNAGLDEAVTTGRKKKNKVVKSKAPTRGYKHWDEHTFDLLVARAPESLDSQFRVDHSLVLMLLQKGDEALTDGMDELHQLIDTCHSGQRAKARLHTEADERLAELIAAGVVLDNGPDSFPRYAVASGLQQDFSLHHSLSLYLLHALSQLDPESPDYVLDVLSMVESILEHPRVVLSAQVQRAKGERVAELKAAGVPYEERMEALEDVTWPKPRAEWIYSTYDTYSKTHPWLAGEHIRPKCVAREIVETQAVFSTWVKSLRLEQSEGVLLRYLSQVYKTLLQNVPEGLQTPDLVDAIGFLRALLARVDDSLVKTWEAMLGDDGTPDLARPVDISVDLRAFKARIRAELYTLVRVLAAGDWEEAAASIRHVEESDWSPKDLEQALDPYFEERGAIITDARMRQGWTTTIDRVEPHLWRVRQVLVDEHEDRHEYEEEGEGAGQGTAWSIEGLVDLRGDTNPEGPLVQLVQIGE